VLLTDLVSGRLASSVLAPSAEVASAPNRARTRADAGDGADVVAPHGAENA
jgi:hypothetical protein